MDKIMENKKGPVTSYKFLFGLQNISWKIPFLVTYHLGNFDDLIQSHFWIIPKITYAYVCKTIQYIIIIPVSSDPIH